MFLGFGDGTDPEGMEIASIEYTATDGNNQVLTIEVSALDIIEANAVGENIYVWSTMNGASGVGNRSAIYTFDNFMLEEVDSAVIPEPAGTTMLGLGAVLLFARRRRA